MYITRRHRKTQTEVLDNWFGKNKPTLPFNLGAVQSVFPVFIVNQSQAKLIFENRHRKTTCLSATKRSLPEWSR